MPMVPPLPTFHMVGGLQPALPAPAGPGQVGGRDGGGGMPSLLQPVQEQAWGMLAGLEQPYPGMWGTGDSADQLPVAPQGRRDELPEGGPSVRGLGGVDPQELGGGRERVLEETKGSVKSSPLNPWSAEKLRELHDQARPSDPRGQGQQPRDGGDQVERLRERCLKEAEAKFQEEVPKLGPQSSNSSFQSAVEAPQAKSKVIEFNQVGSCSKCEDHCTHSQCGSQWRRRWVPWPYILLDYPDYLPSEMVCVAFFRIEIHQVQMACGCQPRNHWATTLGRWNCRCWA